MIIPFLAAALLALAEADTTVVMCTVAVHGNTERDYQMRSSQTGTQVGRDYLDTHFAPTLMHTLQDIPGVQALAIGSGQSKPAIRGLGFQRMAVLEDGIRHEGQQWGQDHGLEIDPFALDRVEVVKGPGALLHGSDAIGGVLHLHANHVPMTSLAGALRLYTRSNNGQLGLSARAEGRLGRWYWRSHATLASYADYRVPTDSIQYYSYYIRLKNRRLRNTAGRDLGGGVTLGYRGPSWHTSLRLTDTYAKSGFFANAHGLEVRLSGIDYDRSARDIDLPHQWANHFKVLSHTAWHAGGRLLEVSLGYQHNLREEHAEPVSHGYMPQPPGTLERRFSKHTLTGLLALRQPLGHGHELRAGLSAERQHNRRGGWGFILPDYEAHTAGLYVLDRWTPTPHLALTAGVRCDVSRLHIHPYADWFGTPQPSGDTLFVQRSASLLRHFRSLTWSAGAVWNRGGWTLKGNVGKSFRTPIAKELGANGINYHIFRYEQGEAALDAEEAYQLDAGIGWSRGPWRVQADPFVNYFPNYIYLSPTPYYTEGLQRYAYTQARVLRWGMEMEASWAFSPHWEAELKGEYLWARQRSGQKRGYGLPFAPPLRLGAALRRSHAWGQGGLVELSARLLGRQSEVVPPEKPTPASWTLNARMVQRMPLRNSSLLLTLRADNLLNRRYYDHTSYYRLMEVPEPGFNVSFVVQASIPGPSLQGAR